MSEDKNEWLPAFARDVITRTDSSIQSPHWRMYFHRNDVGGDKLVIEAISPYYTVQSAMKLLTDAISEMKDKTDGNKLRESTG